MYVRYRQFIRGNFYQILQKRRREQEEELQAIRARGELKLTLRQVESVIEASLVYSVKNEAILQELSELKEHGTVPKTLSDEVFTNKLENVLSGTRVNDTDWSWHAEERQETNRLQLDPKFTNTLETILQNSPQLLQTTTPGDDVIKEVGERTADIPQLYSYDVIMRDVQEVEKELIVSNMDDDFKTKLMKVLLHPPDHRTDTTHTELQIRTGKELGQCYINIGSAEIKRENLDRAHTAFSEALAIGCEEENKEIQCKAYDGLGTVAALRKDYTTSTKNFTTAIDLLDMEISTVEVTSLRNTIAEKLAKLEGQSAP